MAQNKENQNMTMNRTIDTHHTNEANKALTIRADDRDEANGGTSHKYDIIKQETGEILCALEFQHGPIKEAGINGVTNEALLAILIDRMQGFQKSKWACRENALALTKMEEALMWLEARTKIRENRGVEGTSQV